MFEGKTVSYRESGMLGAGMHSAKAAFSTDVESLVNVSRYYRHG